jgi:pyrimidine deaminase RibD-like protein
MELAIHMAGLCRPDDPERTPCVGAVIAIEREGQNEVYAFASRGKGDHAEQIALDQLPPEFDFTMATVYTTLEPCTKHVRRVRSQPCAERLVRHHVKKVVIGILDPNQGVCGKGVQQLQEADIEVELFPHDLAKKITVLNLGFVHSQEGYAIEITYPIHDQEVTGGMGTTTEIALTGKWNRRPRQQHRLYVMTNRDGWWWPQEELRAVSDSEWMAKVWVRGFGRHTARIVIANELGNTLIQYYKKLSSIHETWIKDVKSLIGNNSYEFKGSLYQPIPMSDLPVGLDEEAWVTFLVKKPESQQ